MSPVHPSSTLRPGDGERSPEPNRMQLSSEACFGAAVSEISHLWEDWTRQEGMRLLA